MPHRSRPELVELVMASAPALTAFPLVRPLDPPYGRGVSIHPQPTRAPRSEVMGVSRSWWVRVSSPRGGRGRHSRLGR